MRTLLQTHLQGIVEAQADTLVLGCTHYPFLKNHIRELIGASITIVDTSDAVVRQLGRQLEQHGLANEAGVMSLNLLSTANGDTLQAMAERLLQTPLSHRSINNQSLMI
jgi:glutamate racemase